MNRAIVIITSIICIFSAITSNAKGSSDPNVEDNNDVKIVLTHFEITDANLDLSWKIKNDTDHDVWICDSLLPGGGPEWFLDTDNETLLIRRKFNLLMKAFEVSRAFKGRYVRLRPEQEKEESFSLIVPIQPYSVFGHSQGNAEFAKRLALEIGFYDKDLPGLILEIVDLAEKLGCDIGLNSAIFDPNDMEVHSLFFGGIIIARAFYLNSFTYFRDSIISGSDEVMIPYLGGKQVLHGEQILRIEVDSVSIPYCR